MGQCDNTGEEEEGADAIPNADRRHTATIVRKPGPRQCCHILFSLFPFSDILKYTMKKHRLLVVFCAGILFFSCSRAEPRIVFGSLRLVYYEEAEKPGERFSFFVLPDDNDGIEDIAELYLYHDREGLVWQLNSDDWVRYEVDGQVWIGSHYITMLDGDPLPRGQFRAVLIDQGGERSERIFAFDIPEDPRYAFPFLNIEDGRYLVESGYPEHYFLCYDAQGNYIATQPLVVLDGVIAELGLSPEVRAVALWAEDSEYFTAALTNVVSLR
jgi:hypothetical protein